MSGILPTAWHERLEIVPLPVSNFARVLIGSQVARDDYALFWSDNALAETIATDAVQVVRSSVTLRPKAAMRFQLGRPTSVHSS